MGKASPSTQSSDDLIALTAERHDEAGATLGVRAGPALLKLAERKVADCRGCMGWHVTMAGGLRNVGGEMR